MVILIASPLEPELVERIRAAAPRDEVLFEPELLPAPRYPSDHRGDPAFARTPQAEERWRALLARSEVWYGIPGDTGAGLRAALPLAPGLRWVQGTAAGMGEQIAAAQLSSEELARLALTTAAGVHGGMLAEFAFFGLLALRKEWRRLEALRAERRWEHFPMDELAGSTIVVAGMGGIGRALARRARAFEMRVIALTRSGAPDPLADETAPMARLAEMSARADAVAITLPGTAATRGLLDRPAIAGLKRSAVVINVGRGSVADQAALTEALQRGAIAGAVLDVFQPEPLPPEHPLWTLPNVIFSPHTAALSVHENERIVELFCDNLGRFTRGEALRNTVNVHEFY